jgi:hypothetical protein
MVGEIECPICEDCWDIIKKQMDDYAKKQFFVAKDEIRTKLVSIMRECSQYELGLGFNYELLKQEIEDLIIKIKEDKRRYLKEVEI